jgi:hypothetical protein
MIRSAPSLSLSTKCANSVCVSLAENAGYQPGDGFMRYLEQARAKQLAEMQAGQSDEARRKSTGVVKPQPPAPIAPAVVPGSGEASSWRSRTAAEAVL